jgi:hypothetical protein
MARRALEAAIRDENDLWALLPPDPPQQSKPARSIEKSAQPVHAA